VGDSVELGAYYSRYHDVNPVLVMSNNADPYGAAALNQSIILDASPLYQVDDLSYFGGIRTDDLVNAWYGGGTGAAEIEALAQQVEDFGLVAGDGMTISQKWVEDLDMFGVSFSTTAGDWSIAGEVTYRPDRPVYTNFWGHDDKGCWDTGTGCVYFTNGDAYEEHDSYHASVNGIWLGGPFIAGITQQVGIVQIGADMLGGDLSNVMANYNVHKIGSDTYADDLAYGVAAQWIGTWQALYPGVDVSLDIFAQHDIEGNSHFYGNFSEGRTIGAVSVSATVGSEWEVKLGYQFMDMDDSYYETQDLYNFSANYKF